MKTLSSDGQNNFNVSIAMLVLAVLAVTLRFAIRLTSKFSVTGADYLCLLALLLFVGYVAILLHYIVDGPGNGELNLVELVYVKALPQIIYMLKILYATEILFTLVITTIKISILLFYYNLFHISTTFCWAVKISGATCLIWCIIVTFLIIFQCSPVDALWNQMAAPQFCMSTSKLLLGYEITNLLLDVLILCLPLGMLRTLKLPGYRKASVAGMFLLGGFVCIASIMRLTYIWIPGHTEAPNLPMVLVWSSIQLGIAILCSSLPTYGPLFKKAKPALRSFTSSFYSSQKNNSGGTQGSSSNGTTSGSSGYYKKLEALRGKSGHFHKGSVTQDENTPDLENYPLKRLSTVKTAITRPVIVNNGDDQVPLSPSRRTRTGAQEQFAESGGGGRDWR